MNPVPVPDVDQSVTEPNTGRCPKRRRYHERAIRNQRIKKAKNTRLQLVAIELSRLSQAELSAYVEMSRQGNYLPEESEQLIRDAVSRIADEKDRLAIELYYFGDLSLEETSRKRLTLEAISRRPEFGTTREAIRQRLLKVKESLKRNSLMLKALKLS